MTVLSIRNLRVEASTAGGDHAIVDELSLDVRAGDVLGLIGESGSGKTTAARSVIGLLERNVRITAGEIEVAGRVVFGPDGARFTEIRGRDVGMVFQGAGESLNPLLKIRTQLRQVLRRHRPQLTSTELAGRMDDVLRRMGFADPGRVLACYPYQLSGGMRQRVAIAIAVITQPKIVIADECTSALDVTTQAEVVSLLRQLVTDDGTALVFVTHDLLLASDICDHLAVMYAGQLIEHGRAEEVLRRPRHFYTRALLDSVPALNTEGRFGGIPGSPPRQGHLPPGCRFAPRCGAAQEVCTKSPAGWVDLGNTHFSRCRRHALLAADAVSSRPVGQ